MSVSLFSVRSVILSDRLVIDVVAASNAFRAEWELFLRHVAAEDEKPTACPYTLRAGIKGVELAELGLQSWKSKQWVQVPSS